MPSPISPRARDYVRSRATAVMEYRCKAERLNKATVDDQLVAQPASRTTLASDLPCRIWEIQGSSSVLVGDTTVMMQNVQLSTPWNSVILKKDDEIEITYAPTQDTAMMGKRFKVVSTAFAGELRATRRYNVKAVERR